MSEPRCCGLDFWQVLFGCLKESDHATTHKATFTAQTGHRHGGRIGTDLVFATQRVAMVGQQPKPIFIAQCSGETPTTTPSNARRLCNGHTIHPRHGSVQGAPREKWRIPRAGPPGFTGRSKQRHKPRLCGHRPLQGFFGQRKATRPRRWHLPIRKVNHFTVPPMYLLVLKLPPALKKGMSFVLPM